MMARHPNTIDKMLHELLVADLRRTNEAYYQQLVYEDRLNTHLQDCKRSIVELIYDQWKRGQK